MIILGFVYGWTEQRERKATKKRITELLVKFNRITFFNVRFINFNTEFPSFSTGVFIIQK